MDLTAVVADLVERLAADRTDDLTVVPDGSGSGMFVTYAGRTCRVELRHRAVERLLETASDDGWDAFGVRLDPVEAALRFLSIHLDAFVLSKEPPDGSRVVLGANGFEVVG